MDFKKFFMLAFSESGRPSAKRVIAGMMMVIIMFCTAWSIIKYGMTDNNRSIIETEIITAGALLGLYSITNIWTKKQPIIPTEENNKKEKER